MVTGNPFKTISLSQKESIVVLIEPEDCLVKLNGRINDERDADQIDFHKTDIASVKSEIEPLHGYSCGNFTLERSETDERIRKNTRHIR